PASESQLAGGQRHALEPTGFPRESRRQASTARAAPAPGSPRRHRLHAPPRLAAGPPLAHGGARNLPGVFPGRLPRHGFLSALSNSRPVPLPPRAPVGSFK